MSRQSPLIGKVLGGSAVAVALYTVLFSGVPNFSVPIAERTIADISSHLAQEAAHRGKEARLQYSHVEIQGFAYEKWARVFEPSLDFIYQQWQGGTRFGVSTEAVDIVPDYTSASRLQLRMPYRINVISSSQLLAMLQPATPMVYTINRDLADVPDAVRHRLIIPGNVGITMLYPKREWLLEVPHPIRSEVIFLEQQRTMRAQASSGALKLSNRENEWSLRNADLRYESAQRSADAIDIKSTITLDNLTYAHDGISTAPYTLTAGWSMKQQRTITGGSDASELTLEHMLFTDGTIKVSANGTLNFDIDDPMYGEMAVEISDPQAFLESGWFAPSQREAAMQLLSDIMGGQLEPRKQAIVTISREKNGSWMVGKLPLKVVLARDFWNLFIWNRTEQHEQESASIDANPA